jgi:hypothetical protein
MKIAKLVLYAAIGAAALTVLVRLLQPALRLDSVRDFGVSMVVSGCLVMTLGGYLSLKADDGHGRSDVPLLWRSRPDPLQTSEERRLEEARLPLWALQVGRTLALAGFFALLIGAAILGLG